MEDFAKMPIYEYLCDNCGKITEVFQKMSDAQLTTCNICLSTLQKLVSKNSFLLKGNGWFNSGYDNTKSPVKTDDISSPPVPEAQTLAKTSTADVTT